MSSFVQMNHKIHTRNYDLTEEALLVWTEEIWGWLTKGKKKSMAVCQEETLQTHNKLTVVWIKVEDKSLMNYVCATSVSLMRWLYVNDHYWFWGEVLTHWKDTEREWGLRLRRCLRIKCQATDNTKYSHDIIF